MTFLEDGTPDEGSMRDLVRNTTRRRFFSECNRMSSVLWSVTKGGKQTMNKLLFGAAVEDVCNLLYKENPGTLRKVLEPQLTSAIRWQVGKDRNNWKNKAPKRGGLYTGTKLPFDFIGVAAEITKKMQEAEDLTVDAVPDARVWKFQIHKVTRTIEFKEPPAKVEVIRTDIRLETSELA